jgi:hypothetical protein
MKINREDTRMEAKKKQKNLCNLRNLWFLILLWVIFYGTLYQKRKKCPKNRRKCIKALSYCPGYKDR